MGGWAASRAEGATHLFLQPSSSQPHRWERITLKFGSIRGASIDSINTEGSCVWIRFQSRHLSDFLAGGRGERQMWPGDAK